MQDSKTGMDEILGILQIFFMHIKESFVKWGTLIQLPNLGQLKVKGTFDSY